MYISQEFRVAGRKEMAHATLGKSTEASACLTTLDTNWRCPNKCLAMVRSDNTTFRAKRRALFFGVLVSLMVSLLFITSCSASGTPQEEVAEAPIDRPNIVFILTDDLDFASASKTPQIRSRLVEEGASFEKAFVS